jgi:catechol 2,3-dioxygenase-like lactoylglutathione lyase family enzyme
MTPTFTAIGIVAADMPAAVAFYRRLGLEFASDSDDHEETELAGGVRLMLDTEKSIQPFTPGWRPPTGSPRAALAFHLESPAAVDAKYAELIEAGYHDERAPWDAFWGHRYASVLDPDGNGVDLFAELPAAAS